MTVRHDDPLWALRRGDLAGARELRLRGLTAFPEEIFGLAETLEVLDLSGGHLTALPSDLGRLRRLRVLFCSGNRFERLPAALGDCPALSQIGCRGSGLRDVPAEALPPGLRWLTLTDNALTTLPDALGHRPCLQKLMLAGNRLTALPASLENAQNLELLRVSANALKVLPSWVLALPRLAWLAYAANPAEPAPPQPSVTTVRWDDLVPGLLLGEGASGRVYAAQWHRDATTDDVALKLFKGAMTSDGLPEHEMAACISAGRHPHLTGALGRITGHPEGLSGLVMPLLPVAWQVLAGPPSLQSCTRDVYAPALSLTPERVIGIARDVARAAAHLHRRGVLHGDLYAHNTMWNPTTGAAVLSDFGAASVLPTGPAGHALQRIEVRAWGRLLAELVARCTSPAGLPRDIDALIRACANETVAARPSMAEVEMRLDALMG